MSKKKYFIKYTRNFLNEYDLVWTYKNTVPGYERITRKDAIRKCVEERNRRKYDVNMSGYAPAYIVEYGELYYEPTPYEKETLTNPYIIE